MTWSFSYRLLAKDPLVQEINLGANLIGESAALEILEGLKQRKEGTTPGEEEHDIGLGGY